MQEPTFETVKRVMLMVDGIGNKGFSLPGLEGEKAKLFWLAYNNTFTNLVHQTPLVPSEVLEALKKANKQRIQIDNSGSRSRDGRPYCLECGNYDDYDDDVIHADNCPWVLRNKILTKYAPKADGKVE